MDLATPLTYIKGVGPARAAMLEAKGLTTVEDLVGYFPFRYEDRSNVRTLAGLALDENGGVSVALNYPAHRQPVDTPGTPPNKAEL